MLKLSFCILSSSLSLCCQLIRRIRKIVHYRSAGSGFEKNNEQTFFHNMVITYGCGFHLMTYNTPFHWLVESAHWDDSFASGTCLKLRLHFFFPQTPCRWCNWVMGLRRVDKVSGTFTRSYLLRVNIWEVVFSRTLLFCVALFLISKFRNKTSICGVSFYKWTLYRRK